jgi:hypothetical protein
MPGRWRQRLEDQPQRVTNRDGREDSNGLRARQQLRLGFATAAVLWLRLRRAAVRLKSGDLAARSKPQKQPDTGAKECQSPC